MLQLSGYIRESLITSPISRIADKMAMIARSATKVAAILRCQKVRHSERMIFPQLFGTLVLQTDCSVRLVVKGSQPFTISPASHSTRKTQCATTQNLIRGFLA
ncbi:hypothetical protein ABO04_01370 [Nitrosomonas sp. HPC101]|nr:hypothetical protein [Nitrosomonas sp. HPC101]